LIGFLYLYYKKEGKITTVLKSNIRGKGYKIRVVVSWYFGGFTGRRKNRDGGKRSYGAI